MSESAQPIAAAPASQDAQDAFSEGPPRAAKKPKIRDGKRREKRLDRLRLQGFWPIYAAFVALATQPPMAEDHPAPAWLRLSGLVFLALGTAMRFWSLGYLLKKEELATAGPYGRTRNPLYVGTWLIGLGFCLLAAWPFNLALLAVYNLMFFFVYRAQIGIEEEMLQSIYGEPYLEYCRNVPRFFPALRPWRRGSISRFSVGRALRNRAWEPLLGVLLVLALQVIAWGLLWPMLRGGDLSAVWQRFLSGGWWR